MVIRQGGGSAGGRKKPSAASVSDGIQFTESRANHHLDPCVGLSLFSDMRTAAQGELEKGNP